MDRDDLSLKPTLINGERDDLTPGLSRRSFFMAAGAAGVGGTASLLSSTSAKAQSTDWTQPGNNNGVIELQKTTGTPAEGDLGIDFYGHCAMKFTSPGGATVLFDPWRDDPSGAWGLWFKNEFPET
ncbi:MAG: Zn-dependent hydrolase, partial [Pseudomonadota bacterium]